MHDGARLAGRLRSNPYAPIWVATGVLFLVGGLIAPGSLSQSSLTGMLQLAAIVAIASIGQTLVIQQRGLDLSVPGMISLAVVIVTVYPKENDGQLVVGVALVAAAGVIAGLISGLAFTRFGITPLIATLGVNALLVGAILQITGGVATARAAPALDLFAFGRTLGIPNTFYVAVLVALAVWLVVRSTVAGRRFVAVGASPAAARAAGIRVGTYQVATYVGASLAYGLAGILLAGQLGTPGQLVGESYLLPSIAAVVLGGTALVGGSGSVIASTVGAVFLAQLHFIVLGMGAPNAVDLIVQGLIIAAGMAARTVRWRDIARWRPGGPQRNVPGDGLAPLATPSGSSEGG